MFSTELYLLLLVALVPVFAAQDTWCLVSDLPPEYTSNFPLCDEGNDYYNQEGTAWICSQTQEVLIDPVRRVNSILQESNCQEIVSYLMGDYEVPSNALIALCATEGYNLTAPAPNTSVPVVNGTDCGNYCGWNTSNSEITAIGCTPAACPALNYSGVDPGTGPWLRPSEYVLCGGCGRVRTGPEVKFWHWHYCSAGAYCVPPWSNSTYDYNQTNSYGHHKCGDLIDCSETQSTPLYGCDWKRPGCFDGYNSYYDCVAKTGANCWYMAMPYTYCSYCGGYDNWNCTPPSYSTSNNYMKWCPFSASSDPVVCKMQDGTDSDCTENHESGIAVNGSAHFCAQYGCNPSKLCYCDFYNVLFVNETFSEQAQDWTNCFSTTIVISKMSSSLSFTLIPTVVEVVETEEMFLTLGEHVVYARFLSARDREILATKDHSNVAIQCSSQYCTIPLTDDFYVESGDLTVLSFVGTTISAEGHIYIAGESVCTVYNCILCSQALSNWDCLPAAYQALIVLSLIAICVLILIAFPFLLIALIYTFKILMWIWSYVWAGWKYLWSRVKTSAFVNSMPTVAPSAAVLILLTAGAMAYPQCGSTSQVVVNVSLCQLEGNTTYCYNTMFAEINLKHIGDSYCVLMQDPNNSKISAIQEFTYLGLERRISFVNEYYTSDWEGKLNEHLRCNSQGTCNAQSCFDVAASPETHRDAFGNIDPIAANMPGKTTCYESCANKKFTHACNGCSVLRPSCLFNRWYIQPKGYAYVVKKQFRVQSLPKVQMRMFDIHGIVGETVVTGDFDTEYLKVHMVGNYESDFQSIGTRKLIKELSEENDYFLVDACDSTIPEKLKIGDIQTSDPNDLKDPNYANVVFTEDVLESITHSETEVAASFRESGMSRAMRSGQALELPGELNGERWEVSGENEISTMITNPGALTLDVNVFSVFAQVTTVVCPEIIETGEASGCKSCENGASLVIKAKSTCLEGPAVVTFDVEELVTKVVLLNRTASEFLIQFYHNGNLDADLCLQGESKVCVRVSGPLTEVTLVNITNFTRADNRTTVEVKAADEGNTKSKWNPFRWIEDIFQGIASWWEWILAAIFIIAIIVVAIIVIPTAIWLSSLVYLYGKSVYSNFRKGNAKEVELIEKKNDDVRYSRFGPIQSNSYL